MCNIITPHDSEILKEKLAVFVMVLFVIFLMFVVYHFLDEWRGTNNADEPQVLLTSGSLACIELGCTPGTDFVGSKNSNLYHECTSSYARAIKDENLKCFPDAQNAIAEGYTKAK